MIDTRHALRADQDGDEALLPLFVMAASMLIAIIVLSTAIASAIARNAPTGRWDQPEGWELIGGVAYANLEPTGGYTVTAYNHTENPYTDNASRELNFIYTDWEYISVRLVRNCSVTKPFTHGDEDKKYDDFVYIHAKRDSGWFAGDRYVAIPFEALMANFIQNNVSYSYFSVFKTNFTVILETATNNSNPADHINAVWFGNYNTAIAFNTEVSDSDRMSSSMWTILGQILTLQLPDVNRVVNLLLAVPIWAALGFMVFTIFSRVVPFISGG